MTSVDFRNSALAPALAPDTEMLYYPHSDSELGKPCFENLYIESTEKFALDVRKTLEPKTPTRGVLDTNSRRFKRLMASGRAGYVGYPVKRRGNIFDWIWSGNKTKAAKENLHYRRNKTIKRTDKSTSSSVESKHANLRVFTEAIEELTLEEPEALDSPSDEKEPCLHCLPEMKLPLWDVKNMDYNFSQKEEKQETTEVGWNELCGSFKTWVVEGHGKNEKTTKPTTGADSLSLSNLTITGSESKRSVEEAVPVQENPFPGLPTEIWFEIINYCLPSDIPNLRATCKTFAKYLDKNKNPFSYFKIMKRCNYNMRCHLGRMVRQYIKQCEVKNRLAFTALLDPETHRYQYDCWSYGISEDIIRKKREEIGLESWPRVKEKVKRQRELKEVLNRAGEIPKWGMNDEAIFQDRMLSGLRVVREALVDVFRTRELLL